MFFSTNFSKKVTKEKIPLKKRLPKEESSAIILDVLHGEIAQLARAFGSYPKGRGFDPPSRYQIDR